MSAYFYLQFIMINRKLRELGIHPILGYVLGVIAFVIVSIYIFQKTEFAKYLVLLSCFTLLFKFSEKNRNDFLLSIFGQRRKRIIRVIENFIVSIPFIVILVAQEAYSAAALLLALSCLIAVFSFQADFSFTIPTPFSKTPYEFSTGFRKTLLVFPIAYTLTVVAINVDNLNLGIFSMLLLMITSMGYFVSPENEYFVWIYAETPASFLVKKVWIATKNLFIITIPIILIISIFYPHEIHVLFLFFFLGFLFLWTVILAKYSAYPAEIQLPEGAVMAFCVYFPPLLLVVMPFFWYKSIYKLKLILNDKN